MNLDVFKGLAENAHKVKWSKEATWNGATVKVLDVDLKASASLTSPMRASVTFLDGDTERTMEGVFWPKDARPESVLLDGMEQSAGKVGFSAKPKWFPPGVTLKLRFRYGAASEFTVSGKIGLNLGLELLGGLG